MHYYKIGYTEEFAGGMNNTVTEFVACQTLVSEVADKVHEKLMADFYKAFQDAMLDNTKDFCLVVSKDVPKSETDFSEVIAIYDNVYENWINRPTIEKIEIKMFNKLENGN